MLAREDKLESCHGQVFVSTELWLINSRWRLKLKTDLPYQLSKQKLPAVQTEAASCPDRSCQLSRKKLPAVQTEAASCRRKNLSLQPNSRRKCNAER
jgi:hypothetical protein